MRPPPLAVHRLIERLMADPEARAAFRAAPEPLFEEFAIAADLRPLLVEGSRAALDAIGVHPSMQFKFLIATGRSPVKPSSIRYYLDRV